MNEPEQPDENEKQVRGGGVVSKSLEFCCSAASDVSRSSYSDRNWNDAKEFDSTDVFDSFLHGARSWSITGKDEDNNDITLNFELDINPDADFSYFTSSCTIHDGTLLFILKLADTCAYNIISGMSYDARISPLTMGIRYTTP